MKPIPIPRLRDNSEKLGELEDRRAKVGKVIQDKERERFDLSRSDPAFDTPPTDPAAGRIAELLGEAAPAIKLERRAALTKLATEVRELRAAADLLDAQIQVERGKASAKIREMLRPEYRLRIRAVCDALRQVHAANLSLKEMQTSLQDSGIEWTNLGVISPKTIGSPTDTYSPLALYFRDALEAGYITRNDIPAELRQ